MRAGLRRLAVAAVVALAVAVIGIGLLVLPQRSQADRIDAEIATARAEVAAAGDFARTYRPEALDSADLFRLSKAMPGAVGMPELLVQLERAAASAGVTLDSVEPRAPVQRDGYRAVPIALVARGSFYSVSDFLLRLRSTVRVRGSALDVSGRLYAVEDLALSRPVGGGDLRARFTVTAFAFDGAAAVPSARPAAGEGPR
jgi:Tfp pilus assembly protein PilO